MGASPENLDMIVDLHKTGHFQMPALIADLGCQQVYEDCEAASRRFLEYFGKSVKPGSEALLRTHCFTGHLFTAAGFEYQSFDIVDGPFCDRFDLNTDRVPDALRNRFDLVLNFGTTEHVMNQYNSLRTIHDFTKPGGLIYTLFLMNGFHWHGIIRYTPRFIDMWVRDNGYEVLYDFTHDQTYSEWRISVGPDEPEDRYYRDMSRWMILKKTSSNEFREIADV
jgi:SAM-dependent methyltransferase